MSFVVVQDKMLFCDSCDLGYHMDCLAPPILSKPQGRWECSTCASHTGFTLAHSVKVELPLEQEFQAELPPLPPHIVGCSWQERGLAMAMDSVSSELVSWEQLPPDETVPDIARWSPARVSQYLVQQGIQESSAKVFFDQVSPAISLFMGENSLGNKYIFIIVACSKSGI